MIWTRQNGGGGGAVASVLNGMGGGDSSLLLFFRIRAHDKRDIFAQWRRRRRRAWEKVEDKIFFLQSNRKKTRLHASDDRPSMVLEIIHLSVNTHSPKYLPPTLYPSERGAWGGKPISFSLRPSALAA